MELDLCVTINRLCVFQVVLVHTWFVLYVMMINPFPVLYVMFIDNGHILCNIDE
jgi:hypothetical protein